MNFNNIINKTLLGAMAISAGLFTTSCEDFLTLDKPGVMTPSELSTSMEAKEAMLVAAYAGLNPMFFDENNESFAGPVTNWIFDVRSDDAYKGGGDVSMEGYIHQIEIGNTQNDNSCVFYKWCNDLYGAARCNVGIEAFQATADFPEKKQFIGELKTLRAWFYFDMYRIFEKFPFVLDGDDPTQIKAGNYTKEQIYTYLMNDLKDAFENTLPETQEQKGRFNRYAAAAIAAKFAAQVSDWDQVLYYTNEIIRSGQYELYNNFLDMSKLEFNNQKECIVTIDFSTANNYARYNRSNLLNCTQAPAGFYGPGAGSGDDFYIGSQNLINCYRTDENGLPYLNGEKAGENVTVTTAYTVDPRVDFTFGRIGMPWRNHEYTREWCRAYDIYGEYSNKKCLLDPEDPAACQEFPWGANALCFSLIRYADILLLRAEALVETGGDLTEAQNLVNQIRAKAKRSIDPSYLPLDINPMKAAYKVEEYTGAWNTETARKAVRMERRLELAMEGHRWFDLVRWGEVAKTMNAYYQTEAQIHEYYDDAHFSDADIYWPVPLQQATIAPELYK